MFRLHASGPDAKRTARSLDNLFPLRGYVWSAARWLDSHGVVSDRDSTPVTVPNFRAGGGQR
jgi:hypothetical protein